MHTAFKFTVTLLSLLLFFTFKAFTQTSPFFRLTQEDREKYIFTERSWEYGSSSETGSFLETAAVTMKVVGNIRFYKGYAVNTNLYFGMDEESNKLYYLTNDTVKNLIFDFNIPPGGNYAGRFPGANTSSPHNIMVSGTDSIRYYDYYWSFSPSSLTITYRVEKGFGLRWHTHSYSISNGRGFSSTQATYNLIRFNFAGDTLYKTQTWAPKISYTAQPVTNNFYLTFLVNTTHDVNNNYGGIVPNLNFNDSLFMHGYYSNGIDSTVINTWSTEAAVPVTPFSFFLDSTKMKSGYMFKYRFSLRDKYYRPKYAHSPSTTGFHTLRYDPSVGIVEDEPSLPGKIELASFPNPLSLSGNNGGAISTLKYTLPVSGYAKGVVYDLLGREIAVLLDGETAAGSHSVEFNAQGLPSGVYVFRLISGGNSSTVKILINK